MLEVSDADFQFDTKLHGSPDAASHSRHKKALLTSLSFLIQGSGTMPTIREVPAGPLSEPPFHDDRQALIKQTSYALCKC